MSIHEEPENEMLSHTIDDLPFDPKLEILCELLPLCSLKSLIKEQEELNHNINLEGYSSLIETSITNIFNQYSRYNNRDV